MPIHSIEEKIDWTREEEKKRKEKKKKKKKKIKFDMVGVTKNYPENLTY